MINFKEIPGVISSLKSTPSKSNENDAPLMLTVSEQREKDHVTRTMYLNGQTIFFKVMGKDLPPPLLTWDFAVIAGIFTAMRLGKPLHVCGPVSKSLLRNLEEFQEIWTIWLPEHYSVISVSADAEIELPITTSRRGIFAFSGGLDATYSLLRHQTKSAERRTITPEAALLINGFDLDLENKPAMETATTSALAILDELDVPLTIVETNWKTDLCYHWSMEHMCGLMACLAQYQGMVDVAVVGGDEGADLIDIPWGSNAITNPLLSSDNLQLYTEGAGQTRSRRAAFVAENSNLAPHLRVCWENAETGENCGTCEKCIRTQLNFYAVGVEPKGFRKLAKFWQIALIPSKNLGDNYFLIEAMKEAAKRGNHGWWRVACYIGITKNYLFTPWLLVRNELKKSIRKNETLYRHVRKLVGKHA